MLSKNVASLQATGENGGSRSTIQVNSIPTQYESKYLHVMEVACDMGLEKGIDISTENWPTP
jgi:hypothetical protein